MPRLCIYDDKPRDHPCQNHQTVFTTKKRSCLCTQKLCILYKYTWNTPSIHGNWDQQPLKTQTTEKRCLQAAGIHYTRVKSVDNNRTAKHEPTMSVCLMFPGSFPPPFFFFFFNLPFNRGESERQE